MQIYLNDQKIEAQLTGEKNLQEIYASINDWLSKQKHYILSIRVDDKEVAIENLSQMNTDTVERLDFHVGDELATLLCSIKELDHYVDQIGNILFDKQKLTKQDQKNLTSGLQWIKQVLGSCSFLMGTPVHSMKVLAPDNSDPEGVEHIIQDLETQVQNFAGEHGRQDIEMFLVNLRSFKFFVMSLDTQLQSLSTNTEDLLAIVQDFETDIPAYKRQLIKINECFQKGQDKVALATLEKTAGLFNSCISALHAIDYRADKEGKSELNKLSINSVSFKSITSELTKLLQELSRAMEENDIVAVGDILEYELTERLLQLQPYLKQICSYYQKKHDTKHIEKKEVALTLKK